MAIENNEFLLLPNELLKQFDDLESFEDWLNILSISELEDFLEVFEAYELLEKCAIIKKVISTK